MKFENKIVDVIFPSTACNIYEIKKIKEFLQKNNFNFNIFLEKDLVLEVEINHEFPSFSAELRFEQLKKAIENPDSEIIWCARGGYGSAELLPFLQKIKKPKNKKIFIGFSDISSINSFLIQEWDWQVITAPVLIQAALEKVSKESIKAILDLLTGVIKELKYKLTQLTTYNHPLSSKIIGGCISVLSGSFGTKNQIDWQDKILFLEDEGEDGERLDRYFTQIINIIIEQKKYPQAILLGNFLKANPHGTPKAENIEIAIKRFVTKIENNNLKIPVFKEITNCLGHSKNMMPLVLNLKSKIEGLELIQKLS